jgi:predicted enzyme related to lactoylglutathione lyase
MATPDFEASAAFYSRFFGWKLSDAGSGYTTLQLDGLDVAGMFQLPDAAREAGAASRWLVYLATEDIGKQLDKVRPAGGRILSPAFDIPDAGRMAMVADATGAEVGLWEAWGHPGAAVMGKPGSLTWTELLTRSRAAAASFYTAVFGWEVEAVQAGEESFITCSRDGTPVAGMMEMSAAWGDTPSFWMPYFAVEDPDAMASLAVSLGGEVAMAPGEVGNRRLAVLRDPLGALFYVVTEGG